MDQQVSEPSEPPEATRGTTPAAGRRRRRPAIVAAIGAVVLGVAAVTGVVTATRADAQETGMLRLANLSPTTPAVDMYATGDDLPLTMIASNLSYRGLTPYLTQPAGTYTVQARSAGASPDGPSALNVSVEIPAGTAQTVALVDVGENPGPQFQVLDDETAPAPPGTGLVRVVQAATGVGPLEVRAEGGGPPLANDLFYGSTTPYTTIPVEPLRLELRTRAGAIAELTVPVGSGSVSSLVVTREPDGELVADMVPDAASAASTPGPGAPPSTAPTTRPEPDTSTPTPEPPKAPQPPHSGVGSGLGGLAPAGLFDWWFEPQAPPAPRMPLAAAINQPSGLRPAGLSIPSIAVAAPSVVDLRVDYRGALQVPTDSRQAGWYVGSAVPGDSGPSVFVGHVDTRRGPAVFAELDQLRPGDPVVVPRSDGGTARYAVDSVEYYAKDEVPTDRVYGPSTSPQLRLLTCGGPFDERTLSYRDNVVVFASAR